MAVNKIVKGLLDIIEDSPELLARKHKIAQRERNIDTGTDYYHGTGQDFSAGEADENFFLSSFPEVSNEYALDSGYQGLSPNVKQVNLSKDINLATLDDVRRILGPGILDEQMPHSNFDPAMGGGGWDLRDKLSEEGFEGLHVKQPEFGEEFTEQLLSEDVDPSRYDEIMLFDPKKSALGKFGATAGAGILGAGALTASDDSEAMFLGPGAKHADKFMQGIAEKMRNDRMEPQEIFDKTGWFMGGDGKWRWEIDDTPAKLRESLPRKDSDYEYQDLKQSNVYFGKDKDTAALNTVMEHPELYANYPEMYRTRVEGMGTDTFPASKYNLGFYQSNHNRIGVNEDLDPEKARSTLLHEGQHKIQDIEGFAKGGDSSMFNRLEADKMHKDMMDLNDYSNSLQGDLRKYKTELRDADNQTDIAAAQAKIANAKDTIKNLRPQIDDLSQEIPRYEPFGRYERLYGEAEARNVQNRDVIRDAIPGVRLDYPGGSYTGEQYRGTMPYQLEDMLLDPKHSPSWKGHEKKASLASMVALGSMPGISNANVIGANVVGDVVSNEEPSEFDQMLLRGRDNVMGLQKKYPGLGHVLPLEGIASIMGKYAFGTPRTFKDYFEANPL